MRYRLIGFWTLSFVLPFSYAMAQESVQEDMLTTFIRENPNAVDFNVIHDGTRLHLAADDENLLVNISVAQPALQMRLLMMPMSVYIDPTGKKKRDYEVVLPSALDVKDILPAPDNQTPKESRPQQERPDIQPLLAALNAHGAAFKMGSHQLHLGYQRFYIELDREHELINYYLLLPKSILMESKKLSDVWSIGIFSANDMANMPPPEEGDGGGMMPPPMEDDGQDDIQQLLQGDIRSWTKFSIDDVNNVNLKVDEQESPIDAKVDQYGDSLNIIIAVREIETQLTFLMQGLTIRVEQPDSLAFTFPSAPMVRGKVHHHPNEVKAVLTEKERPRSVGNDTTNQVVRPDVQPLVAALNDTTATIACADRVTKTRSFHIDVNREKALMTFHAKLPKNSITFTDGKVDITLVSQPLVKGDMAEYEGRRLSDEKAPTPRGLGEGLNRENAASRILKIDITAAVRHKIR